MRSVRAHYWRPTAVPNCQRSMIFFLPRSCSRNPLLINRIILIRIVATVVLLVVLGITAKRAKLIPRPLARRGRDGHRLRARQRRISGHGRLRGKRYVPMISTLFFTIFVFNLCGIIPA